MGEIPLHGKRGAGKVTLVDDADLATLSAYRFTVGQGGYPRTYLPRPGRRPECVALHLLLRDERGRLYKDHVNGDPLDNRRANLRIASVQENAFNQRASCRNKAGFKGVRQVSESSWQAVIHYNRRQKYLGSYPSPELAAAAYNGAAVALFGAFARLNDLPVPGAVRHAAD